MEGKMSGFNAGPMPVESPGQLTAARIKELMENAHKNIAARKQELGFETPDLTPMVDCLIADPVKAEKARRAAELKAKIQAKLESGVLSKSEKLDKIKSVDSAAPKTVTMNSEGRTIDSATGEEIKLSQYVPTLKANLRAKRSKQFKEVLQTSTKKKPSSNNFSVYYDPRLEHKSSFRPRRQLSFYDQGKFMKLGQQQRIKQQLQKLQVSVSQAAKKTGIASAAKLATIQPKRLVKESEVPGIEWWDHYLLKEGVSDYSYLNSVQMSNQPISSVINEAWITRLIEHPIMLKPPTQVDKPPEIPLLLTKKERKKLRRQNRLENQKELQEKVRLGLVSAPEPKVRLANLMRVLGSSAVQDPSKVEAYVRNQMDARRRTHEITNANRKLTKDQLRYKRIKKLKEDTSSRLHVCVYRVKDLSNPSHRFKVETNATQLLMTGIIALHRDCNVVVVEGGRKQQHKFQRLMLHRIKWNDLGKRNHQQANIGNSLEGVSTTHLCKLVWQGTVKDRAFDKVQVKSCPTELYAREIFRKLDVEHYWDTAYSEIIMDENETNYAE